MDTATVARLVAKVATGHVPDPDPVIVNSDWMRDSACTGLPSEWWVPLTDSGRHPAGYRKAKTVCAECSVRAECETYGTAERLIGIWGGKTTSARGLDELGRRANRRRATP